jgi:hypothetical protein
VTEAVTVAAESATEATEQENDEDDEGDPPWTLTAYRWRVTFFIVPKGGGYDSDRILLMGGRSGRLETPHGITNI